MKQFAERNLDKALDLLSERLAFERAAVGFYDKVLQVMHGSQDPTIRQMLAQMHEHRVQKKEHEEWLESQIRALGGDPHQETEHSALVETETEGLKQVIDGDYGIPHLFHALLQVELVDSAGWQLLLDLADRAGDSEAREQLRQRLHEEDQHLALMRRAVERFARKDVLGEQAMPAP